MNEALSDIELFERFTPELAAAIKKHTGTEDTIFPARPMPRAHPALSISERSLFAGDLWVSEGFYAGIHWEHSPLETAGPYAYVHRQAMCWHETVSPPDTVDAMWAVLRDKRAAPHFVFGFRPGTIRPVAIQCIPLNFAARALAHPQGNETNRAGVLIQVELCARPTDFPNFADWGMYKALANLTRVINGTLSDNISWDNARSFTNRTRFSDSAFGYVNGHLGHMHVPNNDHDDPYGLDGSKLNWRLENLALGDYWDLSNVGPY